MRLLFVGAHPDDEEVAAGTLVKFKEDYGCDLFILVLSPCIESTLQIGLLPSVLEREFRQSMRVLGIPKTNVFRADFPSRNFPQFRQGILDKMIEVREKIQPTMIITLHSADRHQDHCVVSEECTRAFPDITILGAEVPKNPINAKHKCYVQLENRHVNKKLECLRCYKSQQRRKNNNEEITMASLSLRGAQSGKGLAEAFEVISLYL